MRLNLDDIARFAGVSRTTVSRVINDHPDVSASTRQKVWKVIEEHHFQPNLVARMLACQRTQILGIVIRNPIGAFRSYYASILFQGINDITNEHDYATLMWWESQRGEEIDRFSQRILQQNRLVDGILVATAEMDALLIDHMLEMRIPFVLMAKPIRHADRISYVTIDNVQAAQTAVEHLIRQGRRRIGHITGALTNIDGQDRLTGYCKALEQHGIPFDPRLVAEGAFTRESGYSAMRELLARKVALEAVFAGNDDTAEGALVALHQDGVCIPDDIALVGFDDLPTARDLSPPLTTIRQPIYERGARATALLLDIIEGGVKEPQQIILPTNLVVRQSCGAPV